MEVELGDPSQLLPLHKLVQVHLQGFLLRPTGHHVSPVALVPNRHVRESRTGKIEITPHVREIDASRSAQAVPLALRPLKPGGKTTTATRPTRARHAPGEALVHAIAQGVHTQIAHSRCIPLLRPTLEGVTKLLLADLGILVQIEGLHPTARHEPRRIEASAPAGPTRATSRPATPRTAPTGPTEHPAVPTLRLDGLPLPLRKGEIRIPNLLELKQFSPLAERLSHRRPWQHHNPKQCHHRPLHAIDDTPEKRRLRE